MRAMPIAAIAAALVLSLSACGDDSKGDVTACKKAMAEQLKAGPAAAKDRPSACSGIDDETLQRLVKEVVSENLKDSGVPTDVPEPDLDVPAPDLDVPDTP
ncbi:hypothetical protein ACZ90_46460 [Streptomyces albus subsp. albus]|nr:hypothetical protein ACZ90_46460 [Streptomyces albus subsp. albus]